MNRFLGFALVGVSALALAGCGASTDGGSGKVFEGSDLVTTVSLDQTSAPPGTNLFMVADIRNAGTDSSGSSRMTLTTEGWPVVATAQFSEVQITCSVDGTGSCGEARLADDGIVADISLDPGATATFAARLPLAYTADGAPDSMTLEECLAALEAAPDKRSKKKAGKKKVTKKKATKKKASRKKASKKKTTKKRASAKPAGTAGE